MEDTNDAYGLALEAVEDDEVAGNEMPHTAAHVLSGWSGKRVARQLLTASIDRVEDAVSGGEVLGGNGLPDVDQILVCRRVRTILRITSDQSEVDDRPRV